MTDSPNGDCDRSGVDLSVLARSVVNHLRWAEATKVVGISITPGLWVHADPGLMRILLENLIGNAWKFRHQGRVWAKAKPGQGATLRFTLL